MNSGGAEDVGAKTGSVPADSSVAPVGCLTSQPRRHKRGLPYSTNQRHDIW